MTRSLRPAGPTLTLAVRDDAIIATGRTDEGIAREIGADALVYQDIEALKQSVTTIRADLTVFDASCFDGCYITGDIDEHYLDAVEGNAVADCLHQPRDVEGEFQSDDRVRQRWMQADRNEAVRYVIEVRDGFDHRHLRLGHVEKTDRLAEMHP